MPMPPAVDALAEHLSNTYRDALDEIRRQAEAVARGLEENPLLWRQASRLRDVERTMVAALDQAEAQALDFLRRRFPEVYGAGAVEATDALEAAGVAVEPFAWTVPHLDAVALLTEDLFDDLLKRTRYVRRQIKTEIRRVIRDRALSEMTVGKTALQAGAEAAKILREAKIGTVVYSNGARVAIDRYAEMAMRTKTAVAYNEGTLNQSTAYGVTYFEVFDGADCGWTSHNDLDLANGTVRSADECASQAISHPNCRRSFGPRPDVTTKVGARSARLSTTAAQRADQAAAEVARAQQVANRAAGRQRRQTRASRAAAGRTTTTRAGRARQRLGGS